MGQVRRFWQQAVRDESGATAVEYSCIIGLIAAVALIAVAEVGHQAGAHWQQSSTKISAVFAGKTGSTQ